MAGKIVQAKGAPEGNPVRLLLQKMKKRGRSEEKAWWEKDFVFFVLNIAYRENLKES